MTERRRLLVLVAATAGAVVIPLNTSMMSMALGPIIESFDVTVPQGTWLILLYLVIMTSLQPAAGKLGDLFGHARVFFVGLLVFGIASAGAAMAPTFPVLLLMRILQGLSGSTLGPNATTLIRMTYPVERQGYAMGLYVGAFSVGLTVGPVIGGILVEALGWQSIYWVNLPVVLLSLLLSRSLPRHTPGPAVAFDWWGSALFFILVSGVTLSANLWKMGRLPIPWWAAFGGLVLLALVFYRFEKRVDDPLIRPDLFLLPGFGPGNAAIFLLHTLLYTALTAMPLYLQKGRGLSSATVGWYMATLSIMQVVIAPIAGRLSDRIGQRLLVTVGGLLYLGGILILFAQSPSDSPYWVVLVLAFAGLGTGLATPPIQAASVAACPPSLSGVASGIWYSSRYLGNTAGALVAGLLLPADMATGFGGLGAVVGACAALLAGMAYFFPYSPVKADIQKRATG